MCGLFGMAALQAPTINQKKFLKNAAIAGSLRGVDGTGFGLVDIKNKVNLVKCVSDGPTFMNYGEGLDKDFGSMLSSSLITIGHNRAATMGKVDATTAHPFEYDHIIGAHNGTVNYVGNLPVNNLSIDSQCIMASLATIDNNDNINRNYTKLLAKIRGAYALTWYNSQTEQLYFSRNSQRPLYIAQDANTIYWASEEGMLTWLLSRNKLWNNNIDVFELPVLTLKSFDCNTGEFNDDVKYTPDYSQNYYGGNYGWGKQYRGGTSTTGNTETYNQGPIGTVNTTVSSNKDEIAKRDFGGQYEMLVDEELNTYSYNRKRGKVESKETYCDVSGWVVVGHGKNAKKYPTTIYYVPEKYAEQVKGRVIRVKVTSLYICNNSNVVTRVGLDFSEAKHKHNIHNRLVKNKVDRKLKAFSKAVKKMPYIGKLGNTKAKEGTTEKKPRLKLVHSKPPSVIPLPDRSSDLDHSCGLYLDDDTYVAGPKGFMIPLNEFYELTKYGCHNCSVDLMPDDADEITWINGEQDPICSDCIDEMIA